MLVKVSLHIFRVLVRYVVLRERCIRYDSKKLCLNNRDSGDTHSIKNRIFHIRSLFTKFFNVLLINVLLCWSGISPDTLALAQYSGCWCNNVVFVLKTKLSNIIDLKLVL